MLEALGGLQTAHRLLRSDADLIKRSDLTMEAMILRLDYASQLFTARELETARERLRAAEQLYPH